MRTLSSEQNTKSALCTPLNTRMPQESTNLLINGQSLLDRKRFLIVEDHPIYRDGLQLIIRRTFKNCEAEGVASVQEAQRALGDEDYDMVIVDLELGDCSGLQVLEQCRTLANPPAVLVVSAYTRPDYVVRVLRLGALGYLSKSASKAELSQALVSVASGKRFVSQDIAEAVTRATVMDSQRPVHTVLGSRELEVFLMLARGLGPTEIARKLNLKVGTVTAQKYNIMKKTGLQNVAEVIRYCEEHRLLKA